MTYSLELDFSAYDPSNFYHSLRLLPQENGCTRTFEELGTGQEQILALVFAHAYAKAFYGGIVLVIEEPESHLHPLAQDWLSQKIKKMTNDGLQVVITTHSPSFVDLMGLNGIVLVRKEEGSTETIQLTASKLAKYCITKGADTKKTDESTILSFYSSSSTRDIISGLFSKAIILVEGQTEAFAIPYFLSKVGLDCYKEGISIIPVMGKGNLAKWWRFFNAYEIPVYLTFDNDDKNDADGTKRIDALKTLGINTDNIEKIILIDNWSVEDSFCVFGKDFEGSMRKHFSSYVELEKEAKEKIGDSKPLLARYVAEKLNLENQSGWDKYRELKSKILNILN